MGKVIDSNYRKFMRIARLERDLTLNQLADMSNYTAPMLSSVELGKRKLTSRLIFNLIKTLNLSNEEFASLTEALCKDFEVGFEDSVMSSFINVCYVIDDDPIATNEALYLNNEILIKYNAVGLTETHRVSYLIDKFLSVILMTEDEFKVIEEAFEKVKEMQEKSNEG